MTTERLPGVLGVLHELASVLRHHEGWALALTLSSVAMFVGSLVLLPWLIARAPHDHFVRSHRPTTPRGWLRAAARNVVGSACVVLGLAMLVLPGQGLLMVLIGLSLVDFPGKRRFERRIVRNDGVKRSLDWLRKRAGKEPFELP